MNGTITFDGPAPAGTINFGLGQPSVDLLPLELIRRASDAYLREAQPVELNYGDLPGDARFLDSLAGYLSDGYGAATEFSDDVDTALLKPEALAREAGFQPGTHFSSTGGLHNCMRLSLAQYDETDIREGIARLRPLFDREFPAGGDGSDGVRSTPE